MGRQRRRQTLNTEPAPEQAILVGVEATSGRGHWPVDDSLDELAQLAATAGADVVAALVQRRQAPSRNFYIGTGKLDELLALKEETGVSLVIFDDMLSPVQQRNLERALDIKVIDRAALILDVFARHARTREGQLQVELAQHEYLLPRLAGQWQHLERLGGGIGTRGPGETQIETDRRIIRGKIERLKREIDQVRRHRALHRRQRQQQGVPVISLVGYTNAGKSTLLNALTKSDVITANKLFATLDPTTRRVALPGGRQVLITDTVGFIHKLPPTITSAFRATLEEIDEASVIIHVVDGAARNAAEQCRTVEGILADLHLDERPRLTVINKIDRLLDDSRKWDEPSALNYLKEQPLPVARDTLLVSALNRWGLVSLAQKLARMLPDVP